MSHLLRHTPRMKTSRILEYLRNDEGKLIASFGGARLLRHRNGRHELRGGTVDDRRAAREWISLFLHQATVSEVIPFRIDTPTLPPQGTSQLHRTPKALPFKT